MKKLYMLMLVAVMCLVLAACGQSESPVTSTSTQGVSSTAPVPTPTPAPTVTPEPEPTEPQQEAVGLSIGDKIDNENFTMTFDSMEILDEYSYETGEYSSTSLYVEKGYKLLLVKGHFENKSTAAISDFAFARTVVVNGSYTVANDVRLSFERDNSFAIDPYTDLDYILYINIPEKLADQFEKAEFTLGFNNDMSSPVTEWKSDGTKVTPTDNLYTITSGTTNAVQEVAGETSALSPDADNSSGSNAKTIAVGDVIETKDFTFTLNNIELTYELKPRNTNGVYSSYAAEDGKVYIHVDGEYYNKAKQDICIRDLFVPSADYDNGYTYKGFVVTDKDDNNFTWVNSYVVCTPLETCHYHGLIECPKAVDGSDSSLVVYLTIGGNIYQYTIR